MKSEIERLTGTFLVAEGAESSSFPLKISRFAATINQHKAHQKNKPVHKNSYAPYPQPSFPARRNPYVNPNYKPANKYIRPGLNDAGPSNPASTTTMKPNAATVTTLTPTVPPVSSKPVSTTGGQTKEVVLGGVAFESSARSLVRKDCKCVFNWFRRIHAFSVPKPSKPVSTTPPQHLHHFVRKTGHVPPARAYKQKSRRGRNMTLNNTRRPYSCVMICPMCGVLMIFFFGRSSRKSTKRINKYVDKPCPRFTTTGAHRFPLSSHMVPRSRDCFSFLHDVHIYVLCVLHVNNFFRFLQPRANMHVSTRPCQDCDLLELSARQLLEDGGNVQPVARTDTGEDAIMLTFSEQGKVYEAGLPIPTC